MTLVALVATRTIISCASVTGSFSALINYLDLAKRARHDKQEVPRATNSHGSPQKPAKTGGSTGGTRRYKSDRSDQSHPSKRAQMLTVEEALKEMERPLSGPGIQARLYRTGEISRENAIKWITRAIIYRRMDEGTRREARERWEEQKKARQKGTRAEPIFFMGWERHAKATEEALDRFCDGRVYDY